MCMQCSGMCEKCTKEFIDNRLEKCATLFANLGTDSTEEEIKEAYAKERMLLEEIAKVDKEKSDRLLGR